MDLMHRFALNISNDSHQLVSDTLGVAVDVPTELTDFEAYVKLRKEISAAVAHKCGRVGCKPYVLLQTPTNPSPDAIGDLIAGAKVSCQSDTCPFVQNDSK